MSEALRHGRSREVATRFKGRVDPSVDQSLLHAAIETQYVRKVVVQVGTLNPGLLQ